MAQVPDPTNGSRWQVHRGIRLTMCAVALTLSGCSSQGPAPVPTVASAPRTSAPAVVSPSPSPSEAAPTTPKGAPPVRIGIPSIEVESRVTPVGATDRVLDIPRKPWVVGWWADGVGTGSDRGTTVLAAHLTTVKYGDGPLVRATELVPGDTMTLTDRDGRQREYAVAEVETYVKTALPYEALFNQSGPPRVVLVTCGGTYRPETGHWDSNVVVTFTPREAQRWVAGPGRGPGQHSRP